MPNTYTCLHYHVFFSTRNREPWIAQEWRYRLWEYLGGCMRNLGGHSHEVGGVADHVHLVFSLKPTQMISKVMQEIKKSSSAWVHEELHISGFTWQDGYTAITVSPPCWNGRSRMSAIRRSITARNPSVRRWRNFCASRAWRLIRSIWIESVSTRHGRWHR